LSVEEQGKILHRRLNGTTGNDSFNQFANMFLVRSNMDLDFGIALCTANPAIAKKKFVPCFPNSYRPTVKEFLDQVALQVSGTWSYDSSGKFLDDRTSAPTDSHELVFYEFKPVNRKKPYHIELSSGWTSSDKGSWTMFSPPNFPVGLDIYEAGTYSADDPAA